MTTRRQRDADEDDELVALAPADDPTAPPVLFPIDPARCYIVSRASPVVDDLHPLVEYEVRDPVTRLAIVVEVTLAEMRAVAMKRGYYAAARWGDHRAREMAANLMSREGPPIVAAREREALDAAYVSLSEPTALRRSYGPEYRRVPWP